MVGARPLALAAMLVAVSGCLDAGGSGVQSEAGLQAGDAWTFAIKGDEEHRIGPEGVDGSGHYARIRHTVVRETVRDGTPALEVHAVIEHLMEEDASRHESIVWLRASDLATMAEEENTTGEVEDGAPYWERSTTVYETPCVGALRKALAVGDTWTESCRQKWETRGSEFNYASPDWGNITKTYTVEAKEAVTVEAGTFEAYRIREASDAFEDSRDGASEVWVAPGVCAGLVLADSHEGFLVELVEADC